MDLRPFLLWVVGAVGGLLVAETTGEQRCDLVATEVKSWSFSLLRFRNESGEWMNFSTLQDWDGSTNQLGMDVKEALLECEGKKMIKIQGTLRDPYASNVITDKLKFHLKTGPNTALTNQGYTVNKLKLDNSGVALTHRPLRNNEIFEVKMDKRGTAKGYANGIGITTLTPSEGNFPEHMNSLKTGNWMLYGENVWRNGAQIGSQYAKTNIYNLKAGDRIGVMRSDVGALHFFVNGVDQGPADSNIPEVVYGVYELYGDVTQATIVNSL